ncbi:hypothetical protein FACS1894154_04730 [Betaproteobacteria bacterium]|nr:hypothetical protein FACS1894154_04730 [Betaproteobacteria bacterium]
MDVNLARHVGRTAFRASADLGNLIPLLKEHCSSEEYMKLAPAIASAVTAIGLDVLNPLFNNFAGLKDEFDENVRTYGRVL